MNTLHLSCTKCGELLVKSLGNEVKVRGKVFIFRDNKSYTVCKGCGSEVQVPVLLERGETVQSLLSKSNTGLFVKKFR